MDSKLFKSGMERLCSYFGKRYEDSWSRTYWKSCGHIPDDGWEFFLSQWCESNLPQPANFPSPGQIKTWWVDYCASHPDRRERPQETRCDECLGKGDFTIRTEKGVYIVLCASCENWKLHYGDPRISWRTTIAKIEQRGWTILRPTDEQRREYISDMEGVGQKVPSRLREPSKDRSGEPESVAEIYDDQFGR